MTALHCGISRDTGATGTRGGGPGCELASDGGTEVRKQCRTVRTLKLKVAKIGRTMR